MKSSDKIESSPNALEDIGDPEPAPQCYNYQFLYEKLEKYVASDIFYPLRDLHVVYTLYKDDLSINSVTIMVVYQTPSRTLTLARFICTLDRKTGSLIYLDRVMIESSDIAIMIREAGIGVMSGYEPVLDRSLNICYRVRIQDNDHDEWVVQVKSHGYVESTVPFMRFLATRYPSVLPVPETYANMRRSRCNQCIQICKMVPGFLGDLHYPMLPFEEKLLVVQAAGRAYGAMWDMEAQLDASVQYQNRYFTIDLPNYSHYPNKPFAMGGTFTSVAEYLREWIKMNLRCLEASNLPTLKTYTQKFLPRIKNFVKRGMNIPDDVETVPQVVMHSDLGPHNLVLSKDTPTKIVAILDWEIFYRQPFMVAAAKNIESFFRMCKQSGIQGPCYRDDAKLRKAFWDEMPLWGNLYRSESAICFLQWYSFGLCINPANYMAFGTFEGFISEDPMQSLNVLLIKAFLRKYDA